MASGVKTVSFRGRLIGVLFVGIAGLSHKPAGPTNRFDRLDSQTKPLQQTADQRAQLGFILQGWMDTWHTSHVNHFAIRTDALSQRVNAINGTAKLAQQFKSGHVIEAIIGGERSPKIDAGFAKSVRRFRADCVRSDEGEIGFFAHEKP
jgi:hypothetical protein